jgi:hypothetical protein
MRFLAEPGRLGNRLNLIGFRRVPQSKSKRVGDESLRAFLFAATRAAEYVSHPPPRHNRHGSAPQARGGRGCTSTSTTGLELMSLSYTKYISGLVRSPSQRIAYASV